MEEGFMVTSDKGLSAPSTQQLEEARSRLRAVVKETPIAVSEVLNRELNAEIFFKCENQQTGGSFKYRGAMNKALSLGAEERAKGLAGHSSGNHGIALAMAAGYLGVPAYVVVPDNTSEVKCQAIAARGAQLLLCAPRHEAREEAISQLLASTGACEVHSSADPLVIAGAATATLELLEQVPGLDAIVAPVGGGGLVSGAILACSYKAPGVKVYGAEPHGANDAILSLRLGKLTRLDKVETCVDGLRAPLSALTFSIIRQGITALVEVEDEEVLAARRDLESELDMPVELSSAVCLALLRKTPEALQGKRLGILLSGGNVYRPAGA
jgi:threonine dehydratase